MDPSARAQAKTLVTEALDRPPDQREDFLRARCSDASMLSEALTMLREWTGGDASQGEQLIGHRVGPYLVGASLGRGGMGQVFLGTDVRLHRKVALKSLTSSRQDGAPERGRILREARAAAQINHQNVATIHDVLEHDSRAFIVMEYVEGESLSAVLRRDRLTVDRVIATGVQLVAGLSAAHAKGVVHRDLKPGNIQVTPDGSIKVLDFGVAAATEAFTTVSSEGAGDERRTGLAGTPGYMSPEQLAGQHVDERSDIFSLGLVLFEMATGQRAYTGADLQAIAEGEVRPVRRADAVDVRVPRELADAIARAVAVDPAGRFQTAAEVGAALETVRRQLAARAGRRRIAWRVAAAVALLSALAAPVWRAMNSADPAVTFAPRGWALIADFDNRSGDPELDQTIQQSLSIALEQSAYVNVFSRDQLFQALRRMKLQEVPRVTEDIALEACRREGLDVLLAGTVTRSGAAVQIVVRAIDATLGRLMFAETVEFERREDLFSKIDVLARKVRERLGESIAGIQGASEPQARVTTGSFDALRKYSEAVDVIARGNVPRGAELLQAALALDPDFAMAHAALADVYSRLGDQDAFVGYLNRAYALREGVSAREGRMIEGHYYFAQEQYDEAAKAFSLLTAMYPDDIDAYYELASALEAIGNIDGAINAVRQDLQLRPQSLRAHEFFVLLLDRNNVPGEALSAYQNASATLGVTTRLRWGAGLAYFGLGQLDEARREFGVLASDAVFGNIGRLYLTRVDVFEGALRQGADQLQADIEKDRSAGLTRPEMLRRYLLARVWLLLGRPAEARAEADRIREASPEGVPSRDLENAATIYVATGDFARVSQLLDRMTAIADRSPSPLSRRDVQQIRGELALAEGRLPAALAAFREAAAAYPGFRAHRGLARTWAALGERDHAVQEWRRVLDGRGEILRDAFPPDWVLAHLELARLLDKAGDQVASRDHARTFLKFWRFTDAPALRAEAERLLRQS